MGSGTQVPWTDPGGTPCCCSPCPSSESGPDSTYSPGTYMNLLEDDYNLLIAGGSFTMDLTATLTSASTVTPQFVEEATVNLTGVALQTRSSVASQLPCYNQLAPTQQQYATHRFITNDTPGSSFSVALQANFTYAIAVASGVYRLSLANAKTSGGAGQDKYALLFGSLTGIDLPLSTFVTVSNPSYNEPKGSCYSPTANLPQTTAVSASISLVMPNATYSADNIVRVLYCYDIDPFGSSIGSGSVNMVVNFTPSAP